MISDVAGLETDLRLTALPQLLIAVVRHVIVVVTLCMGRVGALIKDAMIV